MRGEGKGERRGGKVMERGRVRGEGKGETRGEMIRERGRARKRGDKEKIRGKGESEVKEKDEGRGKD